jgi:DinB family protein
VRKRLPLLLVLIIACSAFAADKTIAAPKYDAKFGEKYLKDTEKNFLDSFNHLSEAQLEFKPAPDRWSVMEVAEHVTKAEDMFNQMVTENVMKSPVDPEKAKQVEGKETMILGKVPDRSVKAQAPEALKPTGQWKTKDELIKHFKETRAKNIAYIKGHYPEMRQHFMDQPPAGLLDAYQWLLFQGAHSKRHTAQIEEVKADPNFPKK